MNEISTAYIEKLYNDAINALKAKKPCMELLENIYYRYILPILMNSIEIGDKLSRSNEKEWNHIFQIYDKCIIFSWIFSHLYSSPIYIKETNISRKFCQNITEILKVKGDYKFVYQKLFEIMILFQMYSSDCRIKSINYANLNELKKKYKMEIKNDEILSIQKKILEICFAKSGEDKEEIWGFWRLFLEEREKRKEIVEKAISLLFTKIEKMVEEEKKIRIIGVGRGGSALAGLFIKRLKLPMSILYFGKKISFNIIDSALTVLPNPRKDEIIILLDEVSATGFTLSLARQFMLGLGYDERKVLSFALLSIDPLGVSEEKIKQYNILKEKMKINSLFGKAGREMIEKYGKGKYSLSPVEIKIEGVKEENLDEIRKKLKQLCVRKNKICPWNIYNDPDLLLKIVNHFIYKIGKERGKCLLFSASIWMLPITAMISDETGIPIVYLRENPYMIETRPDLSLIKGRPDLIIIFDTVIRYGQRIRFVLEKMVEKKIIGKNSNIMILTLFSLLKTNLLKNKINKIGEKINKEKVNIYSLFTFN